MDNFKALAELLFPDITKTPEDYEALYPPRQLPEGARVTRFAPSPTGYLHMGGLFGALADIFTARGTKGIAYLRIEDTDKKREIDDGVSAIIEGFKSLGISFDEGVTGFGTENGDYGPYVQSKRTELYRTIAKAVVEKGLAYPCFCTADELSATREQQEKDGALIRGYFGRYAKCRELTFDDVKAKIDSGMQWVLRFRSDGSDEKRIYFDDIIRGKIEMPENTIDEVMLKSDGIPTYHFAHVCDDHFMRTTHVIRGEEWISSVPKHIALFKACGWRVPKYAHTPQVMKLDDETGDKRKLSKRKDPEAAVSFFTEQGFPKEGVLEYLLTLLNSSFEDWRRANPREAITAFPFDLKKISSSGCLFDLVKLSDVCKNAISVMDADTVYTYVSDWAKSYDEEFYGIFTRDAARSRSIVNIDRESPKPRKDIAKWSEVKEYFSYMFDEYYAPEHTLPESITAEDARAILTDYIGIYDENDGKDEWFNKVKALCEPHGFTPNVKEYKASPESFKGHVGDVSSLVRVAVTSRYNTPDLCSIMKLLGKEACTARIKAYIGGIN